MQTFCSMIGLLVIISKLPAGELVVKLGNAADVTFVGAYQRWNQDGGPLKPINPKAKIGSPEVTVVGKKQADQSWTFPKIPAGQYDLVILKKGRIRVEGFQYPPVLEFDPFFPPTGKDPEEEARSWIIKDIGKGRYYENKVQPLFLAGEKNQVRVLVQLVRDQPTSYDGEVGYPVATVRYEIWQYTERFGGWSKERATKLMHRLILPRKEFHQWTWIWEPRLGGIEVNGQTITIEYTFSERFDPKVSKGWLPP